MDHAPCPRFDRRVVGHRSAACGKQASIQLLPGGRAHRGRGVGMSEGHSFAGKLVDVWGPNAFASVTAKIKPAQIIGEDKQDVGFRVAGRSVDSNGEWAAYEETYDRDQTTA